MKKSKKQIKNEKSWWGTEMHAPPHVLPRSYSSRIKDFLVWLDLPADYRNVCFHNRSYLRRHVSMLVNYFICYSTEILAETRRLMRVWVKLLYKYYRSFDKTVEISAMETEYRNVYNFSDEDIRQMHLAGMLPDAKTSQNARLTAGMRKYWHLLRRKMLKFTFREMDCDELSAILDMTRYFYTRP